MCCDTRRVPVCVCMFSFPNFVMLSHWQSSTRRFSHGWLRVEKNFFRNLFGHSFTMGNSTFWWRGSCLQIGNQGICVLFQIMPNIKAEFFQPWVFQVPICWECPGSKEVTKRPFNTSGFSFFPYIEMEETTEFYLTQCVSWAISVKSFQNIS
jgi:hypothetical protein